MIKTTAQLSTLIYCVTLLVTPCWSDTPSMQAEALSFASETTRASKVHLLSQVHYRLDDLNHHTMFTIANYDVNHRAITCDGDPYGHAYCLPTKNSDDIYQLDFQRTMAYQTDYHTNLQHHQLTFFTDNHTPLTQPKRDQNGNFLVTVWTDYDGYPAAGHTYNNADHPVWVTSATDLDHATQRLVCHNPDHNLTDIAMRLNELLGLAPDDTDSTPRNLVTLSVPANIDYQQNGLFRPCMSGYRLTPTCEPMPNQAQQTRSYFHDWAMPEYLQANVIGSESLWTGQGDTYDWGNSDSQHVGVPEYVIAKNTLMRVQNNQSLCQYLADTCHWSPKMGN